MHKFGKTSVQIVSIHVNIRPGKHDYLCTARIGSRLVVYQFVNSPVVHQLVRFAIRFLAQVDNNRFLARVGSEWFLNPDDNNGYSARIDNNGCYSSGTRRLDHVRDLSSPQRGRRRRLTTGALSVSFRRRGGRTFDKRSRDRRSTPTTNWTDWPPTAYRSSRISVIRSSS